MEINEKYTHTFYIRNSDMITVQIFELETNLAY